MKENTTIKFHVLAIVCILIFCFAITPVTFQNDTYYSIAIGKHIIETKTVDGQDPFSWHEDLPYTYPHLAYDVGTYLIYQLGENIGIGGFCALYIATIFLCMILGITIYITCNYLCKNPLISFLITLGTIYLLKSFITARAQLVTYILFVLTIYSIEKFLQTKKKRYPIYLIIISICLANLHVAVWPFYFVLFLPYIAEYLIVKVTDSHVINKLRIYYHKKKYNKLQKKKFPEDKIEKEIVLLQKLMINGEKAIVKNEKRREHPYKLVLQKRDGVKWLIVILLICALTGMLTPLGTTPYTYLVKTMQGNTTQNISEHQPLTLINNKPMLIVFAAFLAILIFTDTKITVSDFFMLAGLTLLSFMSRRQTAVFAIICCFIFAKMMTSFLEKYDKRGTKKVMQFMTHILGKMFTILLVILISFVLYKDKVDDEFVNTSSYPVEAANFILENMDLKTMKLFNEYNYGSYLLYRGIPVFIDSRADLYAPEFNGTKNEDGKYEGRDIFSDYINVSTISAYYEDKFQKYEISHVITGKKTKLNMLLSRDKNYVSLYEDPYFIIYQRNEQNS